MNMLLTSFDTSRLHFLNIMFILLRLHPLSANTISFNFTRFDPGDSNILYEGDAKPLDGVIELNEVGHFESVGRASYAEPVPIWEPLTGLLIDFTTRFSFTIQQPAFSPFVNGFAFFLAPVGYPIPPNSTGGCFGLFDINGPKAFVQNLLLTVEFDAYANSWDPKMRHVGINNNSLFSSNYTQWDAPQYGGMQASVLITYHATSKNLSVFWSYDEFSTPHINSISYQIDLSKAVPEKVMVGFSASTGMHTERNTIISWEFCSSSSSSYQIQLKRKNTRMKTWIVIAAVCFGSLILGLVIGWFFVTVKRKQAENGARTSITEEIEKEASPKRFCSQELVTATDNFSVTKLLGQGGSGQVYLGTLSSLGCLVAVKRILAESELYKSLFINEVKIISRLNHQNLVQFIGWCHEKDELLLIYEYMQNGSLDYHLFGNQVPLPWNVRYTIALGLASALHYLHEESKPYVLHRDIKSANVLLNTDFSTKLGDFGVAKLVNSRSQSPAMRLVGTFGYLAPEYVRDGEATKESDMFSFGVVSLEIACGRRADREPLMKSVWELYRAGNILQAVDKRLEMNFDCRELECLLIVGLWCTHPVDKERPSAGEVIQVLNFEATLSELPQGLHDPAFLPGPLSPGSHESLDA